MERRDGGIEGRSQVTFTLNNFNVLGDGSSAISFDDATLTFDLEHRLPVSGVVDLNGDIEAWRDHFARTTRLWGERLFEKRVEAEALVGSERLRAWLVYLAGVSFAFEDGSLRVYQALATKHRAKGHSKHPPTREGLYRNLEPS